MLDERREEFVPREKVIKGENCSDLQKELEAALATGCETVVMDGEFRAVDKEQFALLRVGQDKKIKIVGRNNATFDGEGVAHILYVSKGASVEISGVEFKNGSTANLNSVLSNDNHPQEPLNRYHYLDGGAVLVGEGAQVTFNQCGFSNNTAQICGGAISNMGGYLNIEECIFDGNSCGDTGAAIDNLVDGSLMVVKKSKFVNNRANTIGGGNYGAVTVFPGTFAVIDGCDFTGEDETAIDWTKGAEVSFEGNTLNPDVEEPVIENPVHSRRSGIETIKRYALVLANRYKYLKKLQGVPKVLGAVKKKHRQIYEELAGSE